MYRNIRNKTIERGLLYVVKSNTIISINSQNAIYQKQQQRQQEIIDQR